MGRPTEITYVGKKMFEGKDALFEEIREAGQEFGATTGRARQINWLDFDLLESAIRINGVNKLVINKMDVLEKVNAWKLFRGFKFYEFSSSLDIETWLEDNLKNLNLDQIFFSRSPKHI